MRKSRATSFDIAELAGVSQATVSRALRGSSLVSAETRRKVAEAARRLNYTVDVNARNLRSRSSRTLALLLHEDPEAGEAGINPFFLSLLASITRAAGARGWDLVVSFQQSSADWAADYAHSKRADGFLFLGYGDYGGWLAKAAALAEADTPFVTWGPVLGGQPGLFLGSDNVGGGRAATEHLLAGGRRRVLFLGEASDRAPEFRQRYDGYAQALQAAGAPVRPAVSALNGEAAGRAAVERLLAEGERFDALFAASDLIAVGAVRALQEADRRVPEDVAVVGFDDLPAAAWTSPPLTTVRQDTAAAGALMVDTLLALIAGEPVRPEPVPTRLVVRRSCGHLGGAA